VNAAALPDNIKDVPENISKEVVGCEHAGKCNQQCTTAFRILPDDYKMYRAAKLPLPRLCPNCRYFERLKRRNPLKLWPRECQCAGAGSESGAYTNTAKHFHDTGHCPNKFETSYAPNRPETVYCVDCYRAEVV
jgi:hypothetical protein